MDPGIGIPIIRIRRSLDRLIFIMGITVLVRHQLYIETPPERIWVNQLDKSYNHQHNAIKANIYFMGYTTIYILQHKRTSKSTTHGNGRSWMWRSASVYRGILTIHSCPITCIHVNYRDLFPDSRVYSTRAGKIWNIAGTALADLIIWGLGHNGPVTDH